MKFLFGWLAYLLTGNPLVGVGAFLVLLWLAEGQVRGRYFNPVSWLGELRDLRRLEGVLADNPHDRVAHLLRGQLLVKYGRSEAAIPHLQAAEEGGNAMASFLLARAQLNIGQEASARAALERCVAKRGQQAFGGEPWLDLGRFLVEQARYQEALEPLERAAEANSSSAQARFWLGRALAGAGEKTRARAVLDEAAALAGQGPFFKRRENRPWAWRARIEKLRVG